MRSCRTFFDCGAARQVIGVALAVLLVSACSGSEQIGATADATPTVVADDSATPGADTADAPDTASSPEPGSVAVLDAGAEPRVELGISTASTGTITVTVEEVSTGDVGGDAVDERESAEFVVDVVVTPGSDGSRATLLPTIVSLDVNTPAPTNRQLGPLEWTLDSHGQLVDVVGPDLTGTPVVAAANLMAVPELFAVVPTEAVGVGAQWQYTLSSEAIFTVRLTSISDDAIGLSVEFTRSDDDGTVVSTTVGSYDRTSLMATDVDARLRAEFSSQTTRSGEVIDIDGTFAVTRSYVMEAQS